MFYRQNGKEQRFHLLVRMRVKISKRSSTNLNQSLSMISLFLKMVTNQPNLVMLMVTSKQILLKWKTERAGLLVARSMKKSEGMKRRRLVTLRSQRYTHARYAMMSYTLMLH